MESKLRKIVEEALDEALKPEVLRDLKRNLKTFSNLFKSDEGGGGL